MTYAMYFGRKYYWNGLTSAYFSKIRQKYPAPAEFLPELDFCRIWKKRRYSPNNFRHRHQQLFMTHHLIISATTHIIQWGATTVSAPAFGIIFGLVVTLTSDLILPNIAEPSITQAIQFKVPPFHVTWWHNGPKSNYTITVLFTTLSDDLLTSKSNKFIFATTVQRK